MRKRYEYESFKLAWRTELTTLQKKSRALEDVHSRHGDRDRSIERLLKEKEDELEISKSAMDQALLNLHELQMVHGSFPRVFRN